MRKFIPILLAAACALASCSTLTKEQKAAEQARVAQAVADSIAQGHFKINTNYMIPLRGGSKHIGFDYYLKVNGTKIDSYLPYFGEVRYVPYGGGKGLNFDGEISYFDVNKGGDRYEIVISTTNEEDTYVYYITVFDNGSANINVRGRNRDSISYRGELNTSAND